MPSLKDLSRQIEPIRELIRTGDLTRALAGLMRLVKLEPGHPTVNAMLARTLYELGEPTKSAHYAARALHAVAPSLSAVSDLLDASELAALSGDAERSISFVRQAVALRPEDPNLRARLVQLLTKDHRLILACDESEAGLRLAPDHPLLTVCLAGLMQRTGRIEQAVPLFRKAAAQRPKDTNAWHMLSTALNYATESDPRESLAIHCRLGDLLESEVAPMPARPEPLPKEGTPIRVGLLSPDLRIHSVSRFVEPLMEHADRSLIRFYCYHTHSYADAVSAILSRRATAWKHLPRTRPALIAEQIRNDRVDILIDLCGLFEGHNLRVLALKPAPIQATYLGYPNTTGLSRVDFRIVDAITDPPGESDALARERLVRLQGCFLCFRPDEHAPTAPDCPARSHVVFGSFNAAQKLSLYTLRLWARVLDRVPGSRLVIKSSDAGGAGIDEVIRGRFKSSGVPPERLDVLPWATERAHQADFAKIDVALDPFPYNGTTTTCETLCAGVPVVSLPGRVHAARVGASLLTAVGRPEWIARDEDHFVNICAELAAQGPRGAIERKDLSARFLSCPLTDGPGFARRFERLMAQLIAEKQ